MRHLDRSRTSARRPAHPFGGPVCRSDSGSKSKSGTSTRDQLRASVAQVTASPHDCDRNPAQYERNRRFGHLVHALRRGPEFAERGATGRQQDLVPGQLSSHPKRSTKGTFLRCRDSESSADDLGPGRGVVLGTAVATLRSVETHPLAWRIRLVGETRPLFL